MTVFKVTLNNKQHWVIGVPKYGGVSAEVHFAQRTRKKSRPGCKELLLTLGGLEQITDNTHEFLTWARKKLKIGDQIIIQVAASEACDPVLKRRKGHRDDGEKPIPPLK